MPRRGVTLIELLSVVAIVSLMIAILLPAVMGAHEAARRIRCQNNLKQIVLSLINYHHEHETFPPGYTTGIDPSGVERGPGFSWAVANFPHMEQSLLFREINFEVPIASAVNRTALASRLSIFTCPSSVGGQVAEEVRVGLGPSVAPAILPASSYVGSFGTGDPLVVGAIDRGDGVFYRNSAVGLDGLLDGSSTTILVGERSRLAGPATWAGVAGDRGPALVLGSTAGDPGPNARPPRDWGYSSGHAGGAYFGFGDGGVRFLADDIGPRVYGALATRRGGEVVEGEE